MDSEKVREAVLDAVEACLDAQLRAVRRIRKGESTEVSPVRQGRSQVDMAHDILVNARKPMHVTDIIEKIRQRFGQQVDRESLVSSLTKRVARGDRFERTEPNTFAVREEAGL